MTVSMSMCRGLVRVASGSLVVATLAVAACSSDTETSPVANNGSDGSTADAPTADAPVDGAAPDVVPTVDSSTEDGATSTVIPDGKYSITAWTCTGAAGTTDVKAFAATLLIQGIDETFAGATGTLETLYPAGCVRTVPISSVTYPSPGTVTIVAGGARTCTATCPANQCTAGNEPTVSSTTSFAVTGNTVVSTRLLDAAFFATPSLQSIAGCKVGDTETVTLTKP